MGLIRLQKYCSEHGLASRRKAEEYIQKGWVRVNGRVVTELGTKIDPAKDKVELLPEAEAAKKHFRYVLLNKPPGYVTNLPQGDEKEALELLAPDMKNLKPVGRLDKESEGLLLFTDDGVAVHRLTSPKFEHEKEYEVTVDKNISSGIISRYREGVVIQGQKALPVKVKKLQGRIYQFILKEGRNRQIRRMLGNFGYQVLKLKRVRLASLELGRLKPGQYRNLNARERDLLLKEASYSPSNPD
ncbi:MAG: rRNA pseudouridine synthase [Candidatus Saganbacteria bacterium]|nr:rRNA pseudouridine synthase [Candidatus Saganbacteria bacterium]